MTPYRSWDFPRAFRACNGIKFHARKERRILEDPRQRFHTSMHSENQAKPSVQVVTATRLMMLNPSIVISQA